MQAILANWKTTVAGLIVIAIGALGTFFGVHVPGFTMDFTSALTVGIGLIFAHDASVPVPPTNVVPLKK